MLLHERVENVYSKPITAADHQLNEFSQGVIKICDNTRAFLNEPDCEIHDGTRTFMDNSKSSGTLTGKETTRNLSIHKRRYLNVIKSNEVDLSTRTVFTESVQIKKKSVCVCRTP